MTIVRFADVDDANRLAALHVERINEGFLASLGPMFLRRLYRRVVRSSRAFAVVAEEDGDVVAFCAAAENTRRFYLEFIARDGFLATASSAARITRSLPRVVETLRYPATTTSLPDAEILAVATDTAVAHRGFGRAVVDEALRELERRGCAEAKVVLGAANAPALGLYQRCGFETSASISIHDDVPSSVLVWAHS